MEVLLRHLINQQELILQNQRTIMSGLSDLQAAVTSLQASATAAETTLGTLASGNNDSTLEGLATTVNGVVAQLNNAVQAAGGTPPQVIAAATGTGTGVAGQGTAAPAS